MKASPLTTAIFGAVDGTVAALALALTLGTRRAVLLACLGLVIAEGFGMAAAQYVSEPDVGVREAGVMGMATALAIVLVALPWLFFTGFTARAVSAMAAISVAGAVGAAQRRELQTLLILGAVGGLAVLANQL